MRCYHGSSVLTNKLIIDPRLSKEASLNNEGAGIYFSTVKSVADSYGRYTYTLDVPRSVDFRKKAVIREHLENIYRQIASAYARSTGQQMGYELWDRHFMDTTICLLHTGGTSFVGLDRELRLHFDSVEATYTRYNSEVLLSLCSIATALLPPVYQFPYGISGVGIIRDMRYARITEIREGNVTIWKASE